MTARADRKCQLVEANRMPSVGPPSLRLDERSVADRIHLNVAVAWFDGGTTWLCSERFEFGRLMKPEPTD
jgi:hypothetical protein